MIGEKISGSISYLASKYPPRDGGIYMIEYDAGSWIIPTGLLTPADLRKLADHLAYTRAAAFTGD